MATDYEKQLEEANASLNLLLEERTKQLDEAKEEILKFGEGTKYTRVSPEITIREFDISRTVPHQTEGIKTSICMDGQMFTADDIANLKHMWSLHMQRENNPPLLYRIWRKIVSCLTTKKN